MPDQVVVALGGLAVAAIGILSNAVVQIWSARRSAELKKYEITFLEKRKAFVAVMELLNKRAWNALCRPTSAQFAKVKGDEKATAALRARQDECLNVLHKTSFEATSLFYGLAPFLGDHNWWSDPEGELMEKLMMKVYNEDDFERKREIYNGPLLDEIRKFQERLFDRLFQKAGKAK